MRIIAGFIVMIFMAGGVQAGNLLDLPDELDQGGFYVGRVAPDSRLWLGERKLKISPEGYFAFGLNWKQGGMVKFRLVDAGGVTRHQRFIVKKQKYDVQHINGLPPKMVTPPQEVLARIAEDSARVKKARATDSDRIDFRNPFIWPVRGRISGNFGNHRILNGTAKSPHTGMDIAAPKGTAIMAPLGGVVTMVSELYYTGNTLIIDHGYGVSTVFAHMETVAVREGQVIRQGEKIGTVGATGRATGPHLHWGLNWYRERLNPALVLGK
ncbi:MAG: peptidase M23 [Alphaproteobacteria bacterium]|nr:MAG: peptidase M23 [Alphaproteobacteria bacterium]